MEKFEKIKDQLKDGDIILYRGTHFLAKAIQWADNAYYNHCGIVWTIGDRLMTIDAENEGIVIVPLSRRMGEYKDCCVVRKNNLKAKDCDQGINWAVSKVENFTGYDHAMLLRFLIYLKLGIDVKNIGKSDRYTCSEFAQAFSIQAGCKSYAWDDLCTPQDFIREADPKEMTILFDDSRNK